VKDKVALFAFNGEVMCFMHVLLNAVTMNEKGFEVKVILEGKATGLIPEMAKPENPLFRLYEKAGKLDLIEGACRACSAKMGTLQAAESLGITLLDNMSGHPSMSGYLAQGFQVITM
jgi:hypothetical protein